jgi:hypothetical protein
MIGRYEARRSKLPAQPIQSVQLIRRALRKLGWHARRQHRHRLDRPRGGVDLHQRRESAARQFGRHAYGSATPLFDVVRYHAKACLVANHKIPHQLLLQVVGARTENCRVLPGKIEAWIEGRAAEGLNQLRLVGRMIAKQVGVLAALVNQKEL